MVRVREAVRRLKDESGLLRHAVLSRERVGGLLEMQRTIDSGPINRHEALGPRISGHGDQRYSQRCLFLMIAHVAASRKPSSWARVHSWSTPAPKSTTHWPRVAACRPLAIGKL